MRDTIVLAIDAGGTQMKAAALRGGEAIGGTTVCVDSRAEGSAEEIVARLAGIAASMAAKIGGAGGEDGCPAAGGEIAVSGTTAGKIAGDAAAGGINGAGRCGEIGGVALAFPGPFDYGAGISYIRGLGKYEALYGLNVRERLETAVRADPTLSARLAPGFRIVFGNDAAMFGLGEAAYGKAAKAHRAVCLTIGTGIGSCYLEGGRLVRKGPGVPAEGWLYRLPYRGGIADDYLSKRGLLGLASELGLAIEDEDLRAAAQRAAAGDAGMQTLFARFGSRMAEALAPPLAAFDPDVVVLGGQISKSGRLFVPAFLEGLRQAGVRSGVRLSDDTQTSVFKGLYDRVVRLPREEPA